MGAGSAWLRVPSDVGKVTGAAVWSLFRHLFPPVATGSLDGIDRGGDLSEICVPLSPPGQTRLSSVQDCDSE